MPGSAIADVLHRSPLELIGRAAIGFGIALCLVDKLGAPMLEPLLHYYETIVHLLDDRYWIDFTLTHQTGHDRLGSDLAVLGQAAVMKAMVVTHGDVAVALRPGQGLKCSTAIGILLQPAVMIVGVLLAWPTASGKSIPMRLLVGTPTLATWLLGGIPLTLWIYFRDIPIRALAPTAILPETLVSKFLLNGGSLVLGALMAAGALTLATRLAAPKGNI